MTACWSARLRSGEVRSHRPPSFLSAYWMPSTLDLEPGRLRVLERHQALVAQIEGVLLQREPEPALGLQHVARVAGGDVHRAVEAVLVAGAQHQLLAVLGLGGDLDLRRGEPVLGQVLRLLLDDRLGLEGAQLLEERLDGGLVGGGVDRRDEAPALGLPGVREHRGLALGDHRELGDLLLVEVGEEPGLLLLLRLVLLLLLEDAVVGAQPGPAGEQRQRQQGHVHLGDVEPQPGAFRAAGRGAVLAFQLDHLHRTPRAIHAARFLVGAEQFPPRRVEQQGLPKATPRDPAVSTAPLRPEGSAAAGSGLDAAEFGAQAPQLPLQALIPWVLTRWRTQPPLLGTSALSWLGYVLIGAGVSVVVESFVRFALRGLGTPAPLAPTVHLVVSGLYRYVRNPMYVGVLSVIVGQAFVLGSGLLFEYAALAWTCFFAFVVLYEEPSLQHRFGDGYENYRANVPRWWPRTTPWDQCGSI